LKWRLTFADFVGLPTTRVDREISGAIGSDARG
jgi:hypothetical protein